MYIKTENKCGFKLTNTRATLPSYRSPQTVTITMRTFQLLMQQLNEVAWLGITAQHFIASAHLVVGAFSTIHFFGFHNFESIPDALGYLIFPAAVCIFFIWVALVQPQGADLKIRSQLVRETWKSKEIVGNLRSKEMVKFINSCHDLEINVGGFFCYQTSTMPKVFDICVGHTITLLLSA